MSHTVLLKYISKTADSLCDGLVLSLDSYTQERNTAKVWKEMENLALETELQFVIRMKLCKLSDLISLTFSDSNVTVSPGYKL